MSQVTEQPKETGKSVLLNTREVSAMTGIKPQTLRRWVAVGDFPSPAPGASNGKYYRWHRSSIQSWLDRQKR